MINNIVKRNIYYLVERNTCDLYAQALKEKFTKILDDIIIHLLTSLDESINKDVIDVVLKEICGNSDTYFQANGDNSSESSKMQETFSIRFVDRFKIRSQIVKDNILELTAVKLSLFKYNILDEISNAEKIPYEKFLKISNLNFDLLLSDIVDTKENYSELLSLCNYVELINKFFNKYETVIKNRILDSISETDCIKSFCNIIHNRAAKVLEIEITPYLQKEAKATLDVQGIINEINLELQHERLTAKIEKLTTSLNSLINNKSEYKNELLEEKHLTINEGDKGITYDKLFGAYLKGATIITLVEPFLIVPYHYENLLQFCQLIFKIGGIKKLIIITKNEEPGQVGLIENKLNEISNYLKENDIELSYEFPRGKHYRQISCNNGWMIKIDRGLHIYNPPTNNELSRYYHYFRSCRESQVDIYKENKITETVHPTI